VARPTKEQRLAGVHADALIEFDAIQSAMHPERRQCLEDRRFYSIAGAQWEGTLGEQFENKPKFEVNKVHLSVMRIINEYRNNRITVDFVSKIGDEDDELADACDGLYRADEQDSSADEAYDNAFEEAVGGGFGAWRLRTVYEDEYDDEDDRQRIRIEPIYDADTCVYFDLNAKRQDKADAKSCFVLTAMTPEAYEAEWGDDPATWPKDTLDYAFDWSTPEAVYVAEVYRVEEKAETIRIFRTIGNEEERYSERDFEEDPELEGMLAAIGTVQVREKKIKRRKVHKYIMSGSGVLEDCGFIAGDQIPIVPVYGKRWYVDNIERCMGHVRLAKDAQRLKNMQLSKLGEISALTPMEKPIFTPDQVAGHENMWAQDNLKNWPYLLVNPMIDANGNEMPAGAIGYTKPPAIPAAMGALLQITEQDMQDILGNQEAGEEVMPNVSGKAIELIQSRLDMQSFIYMSNMAKAVKRSGEIWLSMARDILVEPKRKMKSVGLQGELETVELGIPSLENGETVYKNDMARAKFDVAVDVGPTSSSKRAATVRSIMGLLTLAQDPETRTVLEAMAMMNMEGEGLSETRKFFRKKLVSIGAVEPTDDEAEEMAAAAQNQQPDPQAVYLAAETQKAEADTVKAQADTAWTVARAEETRAKTAETLAGIDIDQRRSAIDAADKLRQIASGSNETRQPPRLG
jgi:hypothetical protein